MTMATVAAITIGATALNLAYQANQQEIVQRNQREAANRERAMQEIQASKERQAAVREARAKRAQLQQGAEYTGTVGSSGYGGATSSLQSQLGANLSFQNTQTEFSNAMASHAQNIQDAQANQAMGNAITGLVTSGAEAYGSYKKYNK